MRYQIKTYKSWVNESKVNEGFTDLFKQVSKRFIEFISKFPGLVWLKNKFGGSGSWILNKNLEFQTGRTPKGVEFIPTKSTKEIIDVVKKEANIETPAMESFEDPWDYDQIDEAKIPLESHNPYIKNVDTDQLSKKLERQILATKLGGKHIPIMIWGAPGIGKTQIVKSLADKYDMDIEIINLAELAPDTLLIPMKKEGGSGQTEMSTPDILPVFNKNAQNAGELEAEKNGPIGKDGKPRGGILFFDEVTRGHDANLAAAIPLIENRMIQKWKLASKWVILGAANREDDDETKYKFSAALGNRFVQINYVPDVGRWSKWAEKHSVKLDDGTEQLVFDPAMIEFLKFRKELFHHYDPEISVELFPTPRSWTKAAEELSNAKIVGQNLTFDEIEDIVAGAVGIDAAKQYIGFLRLIKSIDPKTLQNVWTNQSKADLPPKEKTKRGGLAEYKTDAMQAIITAILLDKKDEELTLNNIKNIVDYLVRMDDPRWAMTFITMLLDQHPYLLPSSPTHIEGSPNYNPEHGKMHDLLADEFISKYPEFAG